MLSHLPQVQGDGTETREEESIKVTAANIKRGLEFKREMGINLPDDLQSEAKNMFNIFLHPSKPP